MSFNREVVRAELAALAAGGVFLGPSNWRYEGWLGLVYDPARYVFRGRFAKSRFERNCLAEFAEVFKTVCVDSAYYAFPVREHWEELAAQVPADFRFTFKVTDDITLKHFPSLPRFGAKAGKPNPHFLDAGLFATAFLGACEPIKPKTGVLIFEFSHFSAADFTHGREFVAMLDAFLGRLPHGWRYGVELRNRKWLQPEYFACLRTHGVAHVFNSWTLMPPVAEQRAMPGSETADFNTARLLLKPGRTFQEALSLFHPYQSIREPNEEARTAAAALVKRGQEKGVQKPSFLYVGNRLEGNSPSTIAAILARLRTPADTIADDAPELLA